MLAVTSVALTNVVELTVMPVPENEAASPAPLSKFVPLIAIALACWRPDRASSGSSRSTVGAPLTVKAARERADAGVGVRDRHGARTGAGAGFDRDVRREFGGGFEGRRVDRDARLPKDEVAPLTKFEPLIVTFSVPPTSPELGVAEVTVGPALTVKISPLVPTPASPLVTVTVRLPVGRAAIRR